MLLDLIWELIKFLLLFAIIWAFVSYIFSPRKTFGNIHSRWQCTFDFQFPPGDFYRTLQETIKQTEMDHIDIDYVEYYGNTVLFSSKRMYMQIRRGDQMFLVCAAPFAREFFVSWWMGEPLNFWKDFIPRIPKLGPAIAIWLYGKTFYRMDTDSMFNNSIKRCVNEVIDGIAKEKGIRPMSEQERQPTYVPLKERII